MKKYLSNLLLFMSIQIWSQDAIRNQYQKENFESAKNTLENGNHTVAIREFLLVYDMNAKSEIAQIAIKKADSLKSIIRNNKLNRLLGDWKWVSKEGNWAIREDGLGGKMITINVDEILFFELYRNSKKWELVKTEKIKFSENPESYSFTEFLYSNKEIWDYSVDENSGELKAYYIGEKTEEGFSELVCGNPVFYYFKLQ
ncbi:MULTISPECIES: hypothetical protein [Flavobacterium]|mgnify:CR=1 FL=1|jgi:hypothetical protein|uniref:Uncharacterized protein n=1 Tax=Flavobacterium algoritolerans TaxID=3041254 RepID=A0ABT6V8H2_9FLAO|nr:MULTISPECIES: hypothetical protein [Flavobacterium]MDI5886779.1 hypothetical protein [Flavobacterium yafengii]MDI5893793.1 hypothetical protein [Flavobacterium algoritolerans]RKS15424.1 hypothetical protein C8C87_2768 [Flavobacterium sp. 120]